MVRNDFSKYFLFACGREDLVKREMCNRADVVA